jgi:hypothetical protein
MSHQCEGAESHLVEMQKFKDGRLGPARAVVEPFHRSKQTSKHHVSIQFTSLICVGFVNGCE